MFTFTVGNENMSADRNKEIEEALAAYRECLTHYKHENERLRDIIMNGKSWKQKTIYKREMNRLRRKLTRIYAFVEETWRDNPHILEIFKGL